MAGVRIVTDSACDLTNEEAAELGVAVVPLTIRFGGDEFIDLRRPDAWPTSTAAWPSQPTCPRPPRPRRAPSRPPSARWPTTAPTGVVCINLSGELSATIESARNAARAVDGTSTSACIDSRTLTAGLGTIVLEAAEAADDGASIDEIEALGRRADRPHPRVRHARHARQPQEGRPHRRRPRHLLGSMLSFKPRHQRRAGQGRGGRAGPHPQEVAGLAARQALRGARRSSTSPCCDGEAPDVDEFLDLIADALPARPAPHRAHRCGDRHPRRPTGDRHLLPHRRVTDRAPGGPTARVPG